MYLYLLGLGVCFFALVFWAYQVYYSLFISPLKSIPGPLILQLFPFWEYTNDLVGKKYKVYETYFKQYGPVVRIGWNKVIFCSEEAVKEIYTKNEYVKGYFYKKLQERSHDIFTTQDREFHKLRKRIMAPSFSQKSIENLDPVLRRIGVDVITKRVEKHIKEGTQIDIFKLFCCLALDVIGEVGFGKSFETLENEFHPIHNWINKRSTEGLLRIVFPSLKYYFSNIDDLTKFALKSTEAAKLANNKNTIIDSLIKARDPETGKGLSDQELAAEATLQIFAGSDSTSTSMNWVLYHLLKNPDTLDKLNSELDEAFPTLDTLIDLESCQPNKLPYLDAVVKETMRVTPPASRGFERLIPKGGRVLNNFYLPENTTVSVPIYSLHRSQELWGIDSHEFNPERWLTECDKEIIIKSNSSKFIPFLVGPRACIGRFLAISEIQLTIASLLRRFNFTLADNDVILDGIEFPFLKPKSSSFMVKAELKLV